MAIRPDTVATSTVNAFTVPQSIDANSSSAALRIAQAGSGDALVVEDTTTPDSTPFAIDQSGQVRIGNPSQPSNTKVAAETANGTANRLRLTQTGVGSIGLVMPASTGALALEVNDTERLRIDNNGLITGTGTSLGAWTSYTPTWANLTVGDATVDFRYCQIGKTVFVRGVLTLGSTSSVSTAPTFTLPVTGASSPNTRLARGSATLYDSGTEVYYGTVAVQSTTTAWVRYFNASGANIRGAGIDATTPFTWTTSDQLMVMFTYEAA